jgi:hypothetical protein
MCGQLFTAHDLAALSIDECLQLLWGNLVTAFYDSAVANFVQQMMRLQVALVLRKVHRSCATRYNMRIVLSRCYQLGSSTPKQHRLL